MKISIYGHKIKKNHIVYVEALIKYAIQNNINVYIEKHFLQKITKSITIKININIFENYQDLSRGFDFMFTFGGDGTILSVIELIKNLEIPIVGVNTGNLGFLSSFNKKIFLKNLKNIFAKKIIFIKRTLLWVEILKKKFIPKKFLNFALNEISIMRRETASMINIEAYIGNYFLTSYWSDGLIVSTPTGSTGYSLSCGGPIILPKSKNFVLTPICPHNMFSRPLIIPDDEVIKLKIRGRSKNCSMSMDTRLYIIKSKTEFFIKKSSFHIYTVALEKQTYFTALREKLLWGLDKRN